MVAARRLARSGARVLLLESADRIGGQVESVEVAPGLHLDVGAEALHLAAPGVADLIEELGLGDTMVRSAPLGSSLLTPRGLRPLPAGVGPAGPSRLGPVLSSRTLTWTGLARAGLEPVVARTTPPLADDADVSVGDFVGRRFGTSVVRTFVDPLLGGLHAGDVSRLSLRACAPALVPAATGRRSLVLRRPPRNGPAPTMSFATWPEGLSALTSRLVADCPGVEVRTGVTVTSLAAAPGGGYEVTTEGVRGGADVVDAVVLAVPAPTTVRLLDTLVPAAGRSLDPAEAADVATVLVAVPARAAEAALRGTGMLVPAGSGRLLKAATHLTRKWPHLDTGNDFWLRLSAGRAGEHRACDLGDDQLVAALLSDLRAITGLGAEPSASIVRRWPAALPQLTVGHVARLAALRAALPPGVVLAGASYDGLGIASCLRSGTAAAAALTPSEETA